MKFISIMLSAVISTFVLAYPGMGSGSMADLHRSMHLAERQSIELIGNLGDSDLTPTAQEIKDCLLGNINCQLPGAKTYTVPGDLGTAACAEDTCCVWDFVVQELFGLFLADDGQCTETARGAIRLGFHDAGAWSKTSGFGGADGSMLLSADEINRSDNNGLQSIVSIAQGFLAKYSAFGVGAADLVQMMATVGAVTCPLGPRVLSFVGRPDSALSPEGLLPDVNSDAATLLQLFSDKTISAADLAALVGAHTTSVQNTVDPNFAGFSQDSTPGVWDVKFYTETVDPNAPSEVFKFQSDINLANDPATSGSFAEFGDAGFGQEAWMDGFARAYVRLSLLGVADLNAMTDCTKVLPSDVTQFTIRNTTTSSSSSSSMSSSSTMSSSSSTVSSSSATTTSGSSSRSSSSADWTSATGTSSTRTTMSGTTYYNTSMPISSTSTRATTSSSVRSTTSLTTSSVRPITTPAVSSSSSSVRPVTTPIVSSLGSSVRPTTSVSVHVPIYYTPNPLAGSTVVGSTVVGSSVVGSTVVRTTTSYINRITSPVAPIVLSSPVCISVPPVTVTMTVTVY